VTVPTALEELDIDKATLTGFDVILASFDALSRVLRFVIILDTLIDPVVPAGLSTLTTGCCTPVAFSRGVNGRELVTELPSFADKIDMRKVEWIATMGL